MANLYGALLVYWHHPVTCATQPQHAKEQISPQTLAILQGHCAKIQFSSPNKSLLVRKHCLSERYCPISPANVILPLHEAACPSLGQGCRKTQQVGICCLFLQCPCCKLPACHASFPHTFHCSHLALLSASWGAQSGCMLLSGSGSCMEKHRGKPEQFSTSALWEKQRLPTVSAFPASMSWLSVPPSCTPKGKVLQLRWQHIFLQPPSLPLQLHQPGPVKPRNAPTPSTDAASAIWRVLLVLACNIFCVLDHDGWFWLLN